MAYLLFHYWAIPFPLIIFLRFTTLLDPKILIENPILYRENIGKKHKGLRELFLIALLPAIIDSLFIVIMLLSRFNELIAENGSNLERNGLGVLVFITIVSLANLRVIFH